MNPWAWLGLATVAVIVGLLALAVIIAILKPDTAAKYANLDKCPRCGHKLGTDPGPYRKPS